MNTNSLVFRMRNSGVFAYIATDSERGIKATSMKMKRQERRRDHGRKRYISLGIAAIFLAFVSYTYADDTFSSEQEALNQRIEEMEALIVAMEEETDGWKLRSSMQEHAKIMEETARLASEMAEATNGDGDSCAKLRANGEDVRVCGDSDSIRNSQYRLLVMLLRHVIYRQNIIMEKAGIFK